jgi:hypothetical protein
MDQDAVEISLAQFGRLSFIERPDEAFGVLGIGRAGPEGSTGASFAARSFPSAIIATIKGTVAMARAGIILNGGDNQAGQFFLRCLRKWLGITMVAKRTIGGGSVQSLGLRNFGCAAGDYCRPARPRGGRQPMMPLRCPQSL